MRNRVTVIGGGAAGLLAAVTAAENGDSVTVLEHNDRVGKKLLATGNGKCNFTNRLLQPDCYHAAPDSFPMQALRKFGPEESIAFFRRLGIEPMEQHGGCVYPYSEQASSVLDALREALRSDRITLITNADVRKAYFDAGKQCFRVLYGSGELLSDRLILATGSAAAPKTGSDGSGYRLAEAFGHRIEKPLPALCPLLCAETDFFRAVSGVRVKGSIALCIDGKETERVSGELQLNANGISGIPTFCISRTAARALERKSQVTLKLCFLPEGTDTLSFLRKRAALLSERNAELYGNGLLNKKLWLAVLKRSDIRGMKEVSAFTDADFQKLSSNLTAFPLRVLKTAGFENAQVATGGVSVSEINPETMESRLRPGLFFAGELMDVDGICGGYNLQWAWTSGYLAGKGKKT